MGTLRRFALVILVWLAGDPNRSATAAETVTLGWMDFPPAVILRGDEAGRGFSQMIIRWFAAHLPQYRFDDVEMELRRVLADAHDGKPICATNLAQTPEREEFLRYSLPYLRLAPIRLVVAADRMGEVKAVANANGQVDLKRLADLTPPLDLMLFSDRRYGPQFDPILSALPHRSVTERSFVIDALRRHRAEAGLGNVGELGWNNQISGKAADYLTIGIAGTQSVPTGIACTKGVWGDGVIEDFNRLIPTAPLDLFAGYYRRWLDPETLKFLSAGD